MPDGSRTRPCPALAPGAEVPCAYFPEGSTNLPNQAPPTHTSQTQHGFAYYCALACHSRRSSLLLSPKQQQHDQFHHLTLHQESHLSSQKIIAAALPFCPHTLLPDKHRLFSAKSCLPTLRICFEDIK